MGRYGTVVGGEGRRVVEVVAAPGAAEPMSGSAPANCVVGVVPAASCADPGAWGAPASHTRMPVAVSSATATAISR